MIKYNVNIVVKSERTDEDVKTELSRAFEKIYGFKLKENLKDKSIKKGNFFAMSSKEENEITEMFKTCDFNKFEVKKVNEKKVSSKTEENA